MSDTSLLTLFNSLANKVKTLATNLGLISDYVVEQGKSGIWTYRKWNSGIAECWAESTVSSTVATSYSNGAVYYTNGSSTFPSNFFNEAPKVQMTVASSGILYPSIKEYGITSTSVSFLINSPAKVSNEITIKKQTYVIGTWKSGGYNLFNIFKKVVFT